MIAGLHFFCTNCMAHFTVDVCDNPARSCYYCGEDCCIHCLAEHQAECEAEELNAMEDFLLDNPLDEDSDETINAAASGF